MKKYWFIISLVCLVSLLACKTVSIHKQQSPPTPPLISSHVNFSSVVFGQIVCFTNPINDAINCFTNNGVTNVQSPLISYGWDYSGVTNNIVFLVYYTTSMHSPNWKYLGRVTTDWFTVSKSNSADFYQVRASNTVGIVDIAQFN